MLSLLLTTSALAIDVCKDVLSCPHQEVTTALAAGHTQIDITDDADYLGFVVTELHGAVTISATGGAQPGIVPYYGPFPVPGNTIEVWENGSLALDGVSVRARGTNRGISVGLGASLTMTGGEITQGTAATGGAIDAAFGSSVTLDGTVLFDNAALEGGAIFADEATLTLTDATFDTNIAGSGGAVQALASTVAVDGGSFLSNTADVGGALSVWETTVTLSSNTTSVLFSDNTTTGGGGAVYLETGCTFTASGDITFQDNQADDLDPFLNIAGGALVAKSSTTVVTLTGPGIVFQLNQAETGGAIHVSDGAVLDATAVDFVDNDVWLLDAGSLTEARGGAVHAQQAGGLTLTDVTLDGNSAPDAFLQQGAGGHLAAAGTTVTMVGGSLDSGTSGLGGALWFDGEGTASLSLDTTTLDGNTSASDGGALWVQSAVDVTLDGVDLSNSTAAGGGAWGGGVHVSVADTLTVTDGSWAQNAAADFGFGGSIFANAVGSVLVDGTSFSDDQASMGGSIYLVSGGIDATVRNATFDGSASVYGRGGGALAVDASPATLTIADSTFLGTNSDSSGGAIALFQTGPVLLDGVRVEGSTAADGGAVHVFAVDELQILRSTFCNNAATLEGGDFRVEASCAGLCRVSNSVFTGSQAEDGGSLALVASDLELRQTTHRGLGASNAGALAAALGASTLTTDGVIVDDADGASVLYASSNSSVDMARTNITTATGDLTDGTITGAPPTSDAPDWLVGGDVSTTCGVEFRIHPDSALALSQQSTDQDDLGKFDGADVDPDDLVDADSDSSPYRYDCDDADPDVGGLHPELCNGIDDDCDGFVDGEDDDVVLDGWIDEDGDGVGGSVPACQGDAGAVPTGGDCDDGDPTVFPGAVDDCDGLDNDCDALVDEDPGDDAPWYGVDGDGDGYLGGIDAVRSCTPLQGFVEQPADQPLDCVDTDASIHPGADEIPDDDIDQDCSGADTRTWVQGPGCGCTSAPGGAGGVVVWLVSLAALSRRR